MKYNNIDVKMDWCNTNVDGKQLDPKIQYPQMVNISDLSIFCHNESASLLVKGSQFHW